MLSLTPAVGYDVGSHPQNIVAADFNNDGRLDLAVANGLSNDISVLLGNADGTFGAPMSSPVGVAPKSIAVGDFDDDGKLDLAAVVLYDGVRYYNGYGFGVESVVNVLFGKGDGTFHAPSEVDFQDPYYWAKPRSVAVGDFNGDGAMDLAVASGADGYYPNDVYADFGQIDVLLSKGDRTFEAPKRAISLLSDFDLSVVVGDFNDDGHQDVVGGALDTDILNNTWINVDAVLVAIGDGAGNFLGGVVPGWAIDSASALVAGDVNGDGDDDLVSADNGNINVRLGDGVGGFEPPRGGHSFTAGAGPSSVVLGDFDRNGVADLATADFTGNTVSILRGRGDGAFLPAMHFPLPPTAVANFDGNSVIDGGDLNQWRGDFGANADSDADSDGDSDGFDFLAWQRQLGSPSAVFSDAAPIAVATGDFDGDGWLDLATANVNWNSASILINDRTWEPLPAAVSVTIDNVTTPEGTGATTTPFTFTVTLSAAAPQPVTMSYRTVFGAATDWANTPFPDQNDYVGKTGTLSFAPGQTTKTITIDVKRDSYVEPDEVFYVDLFGGSSNTLIPKSYGIGTILNDDVAINPNTLFVYDIRFESQRGGKDWRAVFEIRRDSNADGIGTSSDAFAAGVQMTVTFAGQTYTGTTDSNGIFRTSWKTNVAKGNYYANAVDLALAGFGWNPLGLDLEDDSDGNGLPDALLSVS